MMSWASWRKLSTIYFGEWIPPVRQLRQFVTDASHELRNPDCDSHGETELLLSKPRTAEEYQKTLAIFDDELNKLTRMVEGLFTLSTRRRRPTASGVGTGLH